MSHRRVGVLAISVEVLNSGPVQVNHQQLDDPSCAHLPPRHQIGSPEVAVYEAPV
jgi:hypothetical protein